MFGRLNGFLAEVVAVVRAEFGGPVSNADVFRDELRAHRAHRKPVTVTESGTCAYRGAGLRGGIAWQVADDAVYDEDEQARYFTELMDVYEAEGVDAALWFTFAGFHLPGAADTGSYGVVRLLDESRSEPKAVYAAMARRYARGTMGP